MPPARSSACLVPLMLALAGSLCTASAKAQGIRVTPLLNLEGGYFERRGSIDRNGREGTASLSPGLSLSANTGSLRGALEYSGRLIERRGIAESAGQEWENSLSAAFLVEAVPRWAFVDVSASMSQQSISAFGQQSATGSVQANANRTEVATLSVTPYVRGSLSGWADYEVRLQGSRSASRDAAGTDSRSRSASVTLSSPSRGALFGWSVLASDQRNELSSSSEEPLANRRLNASLNVTPNPEIRLQLGAGRETAADGGITTGTASNNVNAGLFWTPSVRTSLSAEVAKRYFGRSDHLSFSHRSPRTAWSYSYARDLQTGADGTLFGAPRSLFDQYYELAASVVPDPDQRRLYVLLQMLSEGKDPTEVTVPVFQTTSYSITRRQDAAFAWTGVRTTLSLSAYTNSQSQIITLDGGDPLLAEPTRQHGYTSTLSYRLTPLTTVSFGGQRLMTFGTSQQNGTDLKSANAGITSQIGRRTTASVNARYSVFNSATDPYRETSVQAALGLRF